MTTGLFESMHIDFDMSL